MLKTRTLRELLIDELEEIYNAEQQLLTALPRMAQAARNNNLKGAFREHQGRTEWQVERIEQVFKLLNTPAQGRKCIAMEGLIADGEAKIRDDTKASVKDAALIAAAQKMEHYEIAAYGTVRSFAEMLGCDEIASLLRQTLEEETETDKALTALASSINPEAARVGVD